MTISQKVSNLLRSGLSMSVAGTIAGTGAYVLYKDMMRYPRMIKTYKEGNILAPLKENQYEIKYCTREKDELRLGKVLESKFANEYYLINGDVGSGKTRSLVEITRHMIKTSGSRGLGAPVYVAVSQGTSFPDSLAAAVNFSYDEHISFKFFLDFLLKINSFPSRDPHNKLIRVLDAIERSAFIYMQETGKPVVLIFDGVNDLDKHMPGCLKKLQDKAKLWADTNTVKVVFASNEDKTEFILQEHHSNWSRAATPISIGDLTFEESLCFLCTPGLLECQLGNDEDAAKRMDQARASHIFSHVGGRLHYLIAFKRDHLDGIPVHDTVSRLQEKEREKFLQVSRVPSMWKAVEVLTRAPNKTMYLSKLIQATSTDDVMKLADAHVINIERDKSGVMVRFESKLTQNVVDEFYKRC